MNDTSEEQPKKTLAKKVITPKRRYFHPATGANVEAESIDDAILEIKKTKQVKAGDER